MRRSFLVLLLVACASPGTTEEITRPAPIFERKETGTVLGERPRAFELKVAAAPATVWLALRKVYPSLEIAIAVDNPPGHQIGNRDFYKTRRLAGRPMEDLIDCGSGITGLRAASYRIYLSSITDVLPDSSGGGTKIQTILTAAGQDMSGTSTERIPCTSKGTFEQLLLDRVQALVGR